jgi:predicted nucleic acid-binding protein
MVVFDTSLLIDASKKKKYVSDLIDSYLGKERVATTIITQYELLRGATERSLGFVLALLSRFVILDFKEEAVDEAVKAYKSLREKGKLISELDFLVAGIAAANNETLITKDKDFLNLESNKIIVLPQR